jgi:hypothetical protein
MPGKRQKERRMSSTPGPPAGAPAGKLILIGRKEFVAFPEWGVERVRAKVDTGAYSSALGVIDHELIETPEEVRVRFHVPLSRRHPERVQPVEAPVLKLVTVRSSSGCLERRPLIEARVRLGPLTRMIRLTLTRRAGMRCPMLLGRQSLAGTFLVDVSARYLLGTGRPN